MKSKLNLRRSLIAGLFLFLCFSAGSVHGQQIINGSLVRNENYRIGPGDVIDIMVNRNESLSRQGVRVSNQGMIELKMIEAEVSAACLTERELADQIKEKYKKYLLNPQVIVTVKEFNSTPVTLLGEITVPGQFQLQRPTRLQEVITMRNGPTNKAGDTIQIIRNPEAHSCGAAVVSAPADEQLLIYPLASTLKAEEKANPFVQPGDVIRIVEAEEVKKTQAYIIGNVKNAMTIDLREKVTLTQAVAMAGGTSPGAQLDKIKISRQIAGTTDKTSMMVNLKEINKTNKGDFYLEPNDIVDIPGPSAFRKGLKEALRTLPGFTRFPLGF